MNADLKGEIGMKSNHTQKIMSVTDLDAEGVNSKEAMKQI